MMSIFKNINKKNLLEILLISLLVIIPTCRFLRDNLVILPSYKSLLKIKAKKKALLWAKQDSIRVADSLKRIGIDTSDNRKAQPNYSVKQEVETLTLEDNSNLFYIIIGSYANPENTKKAAVEYRSKGYETRTIRTTNRYGNKVELLSIKTFEDRDEAFSYLIEVHSKINSNAWIYPPK